ncbi:nephrocystin-3 isoform X1 [Selaginella moellendorffii]|uniref:nephrocystin-3 isoform X1 n=1 Tax=Selaginella moellendorffii TaxID=88036 RepID=UPI000D1CA69D|nr:nephrocystin-3 isoform X1 [Selaginella moellendorffii]|eukprot:XP_024522176.1 nephrocystin-3 isoform X1 [Selaginella moellendorffii]
MAANAFHRFVVPTHSHLFQQQQQQQEGPLLRVLHRRKPLRTFVAARKDVASTTSSSTHLEKTAEVVAVDELKKDLDGLRQKLANLIEQGEEEYAEALLDANYKVLKRQLDGGEQGIEQAALLDVLAQGHLDMGDVEGAAPLLTQLTQLMEKNHFDSAKPEPLVDKVVEHMAAMYATLDQPDRAIELYERCLRMQEDLYGGKRNDSPLLVNALFGYAAACKDAGHLDKSTEQYIRAIAILEKANGPDSQILVLPLQHLGLALLERGNHVEAEQTLSRALKLAKEKPNDGRVGVVMSSLAQAKYMTGDNEASADLFREALRVMERSTTPDPLLIESMRTDFSMVLTVLERHKEAQEVLEDNVHAVQNRLGSSDIGLFVHMKNLAVSHANCGNLVKCESLMRRCLQLATAHYGPNAPELSGALEMLATLLHHMERHTEAEPLARQSLLLCEARYGREHPFSGDACNTLAAILFALERFPEAHVLMSRVLDIQTRELGPYDPLVGKTLEYLVMINSKLGRDSTQLLKRLKDIQGDK